MPEKGLVIVVSGPSGVGKGTVIQNIVKEDDDIKYSISATTRKPRDGESDGENYFFKKMDEFKKMIEKDELLEWVEYCGNYYGTPKAYIDQMISEGKDVVVEIEVEGAFKVNEFYPDSISIFVLPPSIGELRNRIQRRGSERACAIEKRMIRAEEELEYVNKYKYVVINESVEKTIREIKTIIEAERLKYEVNKLKIDKIIEEGL